MTKRDIIARAGYFLNLFDGRHLRIAIDTGVLLGAYADTVVLLPSDIVFIDYKLFSSSPVSYLWQDTL